MPPAPTEAASTKRRGRGETQPTILVLLMSHASAARAVTALFSRYHETMEVSQEWFKIGEEGVRCGGTFLHPLPC